MIRRTDAPIIWIDQFCMNSWAHLKVWCRSGALCNQHPTGKAGTQMKSSHWMPTVPRMPLLWGRSVPARATHPVMSIPEVPGAGWTVLPAQMEHKCPSVAQDISVSPGRLWSSWVPCLIALSQGGHGLWGNTYVGNISSVAVMSWAARLVFDTERVLCLQWLCSAVAALLLLPKVAGLVKPVQKAARHIPLGILSVSVRSCCSVYLGFWLKFFDVLGISHSILQRFC